ncbi:MAG: MMPL family transporter [Gammaproteobacteria bacterium]|nr:MMPL family transporter [Gammaproteobacteria bacterium]
MSSIWQSVDHRLRALGYRYTKGLLWLVEYSYAHARTVLALTLAMFLASSYYSATHFSMDTDTSNMLSRDLPFQRLEHSYHQAFPQTRNTLVVVIDGDTSALAASALERLEAWVRAHPAEFSAAYAPGGGEFFQRNGLLFLDKANLQTLANRIVDAQPLIASLSRDASLKGLLGLLDTAMQQRLTGGQRIAGLSPLLDQMTQAAQAQIQGRYHEVRWGALMAGGDASASERQRFLVLNPVLNHASLEPAAMPIRALRTAIRNLGLDAAHGVHVGMTGDALLDSEQIKTVSEGAGLALGLTLGLELILLAVALRSARLVISVLASLLTGMILSTTLALLFVGPFNLLSVAFAVLFIGLGVDFGIQFCLRYREESYNGAPHPVALRRVAAGLGGALSLAATAAAISFFSFVPTRYAGMVDLGLISGISMFVALLATLTLLPALLTIWPLRRKETAKPVMGIKGDLPIGRHPIHRYGRWIVGGSLLLSLAAIPLIAQVRFDFDPINMINPHSEGVRVFRKLLQDDRNSPYRIEVVAPTLAAAGQLAARLQRLPEVSQALTLASFIPSGQEDKLAILQNLQLLVPPFSLHVAPRPAPPGPDLPAALARFESNLRDLAARDSDAAARHSAASLLSALQRFHVRFGDRQTSFAELQQRIMGGLPATLNRLALALTAAPVTLDSLPADLRSRYLAVDGRARVEVFPRHNLSQASAMERFVSAVRAVAPQAVGAPIMLVDGGQAVASAFREASAIALVLIVGLLLVVLRRWTDMLLVMVPLLLAAAFTVATMTLLGLPFNLGNIIVLPLLIGLGVAFAIYLVARWRQGVSISHLLQTSTPAAVFFSGLTTLSSFGSMAISSDPGMASLGKTLTLALLMVLLCILVVLPAMLMLFTPSPREDTPDTHGTQ